jgi:hypothetical protein
MSFIWNYLYGNTIPDEPTPALIHQKFLICKQLKASNLRLRKVEQIKKVEEEKNDMMNSWKALIRNNKLQKKNKKKIN